MQTLEEVLSAIEAHAAQAELRESPRVLGEVAQQGDVYLHRVAEDHPRGKLLGTRQIAVGTTIGSRHVVEGHVDVYEGKKLPPGFKLPEGATEADMLGPVVVVHSSAVLTHPEHAHHALECGVDQVTYQWDETTRARQQD
jgi:hypothetical protein